MTTVTIFLHDPATLRVSFGYNAALVDAVKTVEGATFDKPSRTWRVPLRKLDKLLAVVGDVAAVAPEVFLAASPTLPVEHFANTCAMGHVTLAVVGDRVQGSGGAWTPLLQAEIDKRAAALRWLLASGWQPYTPEPVPAPPEPRPVEELTHVTAVDVSEFAVACARENARRNGLSDVMECVAANVFDLLPQLEQQPKRYDFIILDPPAFTKSRKTTQRAMTGYKEINYRAMRLLPRGGYLATCSCSHFATEELFLKMLRSAAKDAGVQLRQIEARQQCCDHPILWGVEETNYLKFYLFQVV